MECKKLKGCSEHGKCAKIPNSDDLKPHTCECDEVRINLEHSNMYSKPFQIKSILDIICYVHKKMYNLGFKSINQYLIFKEKFLAVH